MQDTRDSFVDRVFSASSVKPGSHLSRARGHHPGMEHVLLPTERQVFTHPVCKFFIGVVSGYCIFVHFLDIDIEELCTCWNTSTWLHQKRSTPTATARPAPRTEDVHPDTGPPIYHSCVTAAHESTHHQKHPQTPRHSQSHSLINRLVHHLSLVSSSSVQ